MLTNTQTSAGPITVLGSFSRKLLSGDRRVRRRGRREFRALLERGVELATVKTRELDNRKPRSCVTELIPDFPELDHQDFLAWHASIRSTICSMYNDDAKATMLERIDQQHENDVIAFRDVIALLRRLARDPQVDLMSDEYRDS